MINLMICHHSFSQTDNKLIKYEIGFEFEEGIYLSFLDFKHNTPIPSSEIISDFDGDSRDFYNMVISEPSIKYFNGKDTVKVESNIWGYSDGRSIYVVTKDRDICVLNVIGSICTYQGVKVITTYMNPTGIPMPTKERIIINGMFDWKSGEMKDFNRKNFEELLKIENEIYQEYLNYKGNKQGKIFLFIRKYNEKHPIYFYPSKR